MTRLTIATVLVLIVLGAVYSSAVSDMGLLLLLLWIAIPLTFTVVFALVVRFKSRLQFVTMSILVFTGLFLAFSYYLLQGRLAGAAVNVLKFGSPSYKPMKLGKGKLVILNLEDKQLDRSEK